MEEKKKTAAKVTAKETGDKVPVTETIYQGLALFQSQCPPIKKDSEAGTKFKYKYGSLPHVLEQIKPYMAAAGLGFTQPIVMDRGPEGPIELIKTILFHVVDEETIESQMELPDFKFDQMNVMQSKGSIITYLRRYAIMSILGIVAEEDDNDAQGDGKKVTAPAASGKTDALPWLNPEPKDKWNAALKYLADGGKIGKIKSKYRLSKVNEERLLNEAITFDDLPFDRQDAEDAEIFSTEGIGADEPQADPGEVRHDGPNTLFDEQGKDPEAY